MAARGEIRLGLAGLKRIVITVSPASNAPVKPGLSLYIGNELAGHCRELGKPGEWSTAEFLVDSKSREVVGVSLVSENRDQKEPVPVAFVPHQILKNGDWRELGLLVSSIRISNESI